MIDEPVARGTGAFVAILLLASCVTTPSPPVYWFHPSVEERLQQSRFTLDSTECSALARQYIPEPDSPAPNAFEAGRQQAQRERARRDYEVACLINRGWEQHIRPAS